MTEHMSDRRSMAKGVADSSGVIEVKELSHKYRLSKGRVIEVLQDLSFVVSSGEVACFVGPSGCGKSTLLNLVAGLSKPASGVVMWDGREIVAGVNPDMAMAFQSPGLFPWMTVRRNVTVGLETRGKTSREAREIADEMLEAVGLTDFASAYPSQLSGGMAQRVGIARAFALRPRLLLLDEPFAAVDAFTRLTLQAEFKSLFDRYRPTVLFVTHDVDEAIAVGDTVVAMTARPGRVKETFAIEQGDHKRGSNAYAHKLGQILASLGVTHEHTED